MKKTLKRRRRLAIGILYVLFLLTVVEVALQLFYFARSGEWLFRRIAVPIYAPDALRGWVVKPNLRYRHKTGEFSVEYITNSQGFRTDRQDAFYLRQKPTDVYRIMMIGPSFTFGWANDYDDTHAAQLENTLQHSTPLLNKTVEVINAGIPARDGIAQTEWYRQVGGGYRPDLVVLMIYGSMILPGRHAEARYEVSKEGYLLTPGTNHFVRLRKIAKRSGIVFHGYLLSRRIVEIYRKGHGKHVRRSVSGTKSNYLFDPNSPGAIRTQQRLQELRDLVERSGGKFMLVRIPMSYEVYPEDKKRWENMDYKDPQQITAFNNAAGRRYAHILEVPFTDLTPALQAEAHKNGRRLYYRLDVHWTPEGNRVAAQTIAQTIVEHINLQR